MGKCPVISENKHCGIFGVIGQCVGIVDIIKISWMATAMSRSVWVCSRNDAIGNVAVILAGMAVYFFQSKYPDLIVAFVLAFLALQASQGNHQKGLGGIKSQLI
ncbi:hypothetical protein MZB00_09665 [Haemophilus influenzae]|nr:hypothetical protein [Haemophilus influenzae]